VINENSFNSCFNVEYLFSVVVDHVHYLSDSSQSLGFLLWGSVLIFWHLQKLFMLFIKFQGFFLVLKQQGFIQCLFNLTFRLSDHWFCMEWGIWMVWLLMGDCWVFIISFGIDFICVVIMLRMMWWISGRLSTHVHVCFRRFLVEISTLGRLTWFYHRICAFVWILFWFGLRSRRAFWIHGNTFLLRYFFLLDRRRFTSVVGR
jgi:hypothetical protein